MIVFLTVIYIVILAVLVKLKVIKLNLWWKLSPLIWMVFLLIVLFIPMQFWAPSGSTLVAQHSVPIVPNVSGEVLEVAVDQDQEVRQGDVLFTIDPTPYIAARDQIEAQLELAEVRLEQTKALRAQDAVSIYELDQYQAQVKQLRASLDNAEYNLEQTVVTAPADGFATNVALRPGARVAQFPVAPAMAFVENSERVVGAQILQGHLRYIEPDMDAEVTFKLFPGKVYNAKVNHVVKASATGQALPSGSMVAPREINSTPFVIHLRIDDDNLMNTLPAGAVGTVAIYSDKGEATHIIRKVMIRMDAFMNYIIP